jgi:hypothetical protein
MIDRAPRTRRNPVRHLIGILAALCLALPALAEPSQKPGEKQEADKVAKKMEKARGTAQQAEEERKALRNFQEEVAEYAVLHGKQLAKLGARDKQDPQKALAHALEAKRAKAEQGDIFQPEVQPLFRRLIAEQLAGADAVAARKAMLEGNPEDEPGEPAGSAPIVVSVNGAYPLGATRSTVPPSVLATLPPLPSCLHYRFVGRDLILVDSVAGLIVDFLPSAAPEPAVK